MRRAHRVSPPPVLDENQRRVVEHEGGSTSVTAGECILTRAGEWVRYSVGASGADYLAVCSPAFTAAGAHRDA